MKILFQNDGEIDLRFISTFGCSVKESKNPIGFFGTGLKFALAILLRTSHKVEIQSGLRRFQVISQKESLRGKEFELVFAVEHWAQPTALGFTTELGKNWEVWMAYRELYCNAKDEPNGVIETVSETPNPEPGKTRILASGNSILQIHQSRSEYILESPPDSIFDDVEIINKPSTSLFYKGIRVMDFRIPALLTYNIKSEVKLTEDRTVADSSAVSYKIARALLGHGDKCLLEKVLTAKSDNYEHFFDFHGWDCTPSPDFFPAVDALQRSELTKVNASALRLWREKCKGVLNPRRITPTNVQFETLQRAISFCEKAGFELRSEYPIFVVETLGGDGVMAAADREGRQIFLTQEIFDSGGTKGVARALIEEYIHLRFSYDDCSRQMQNYLFGRLISLAEEKNGEPI